MASNTRVEMRAPASVLGGHEIEWSSGDAGYHHASVWYFSKCLLWCLHELVTANEFLFDSAPTMQGTLLLTAVFQQMDK